MSEEEKKEEAPETETDTDADADAETETDTDADADAETETETDSDSDSDSDSAATPGKPAPAAPWGEAEELRSEPEGARDEPPKNQPEGARDEPPKNQPKAARWLDDPKHVNLLVYLCYGLCGFLVLTHLLGLAGVYDLHGHYSWETWPGFYALYGFGAYMGLVVLAEVLRAAVQKAPDYYDAFDPEPPTHEPDDHGHGHGHGGH